MSKVWTAIPLRTALFVAFMLAVSPLGAVVQPAEPAIEGGKVVPAAGALDVRVNLPDVRKSALEARPGVAAASAEANVRALEMARAIVEATRLQPGLEVKVDAAGVVSSVRNKRGALTEAAPAKSNEAIVRGFLREQGAIYGLSAADLGDLAVLGSSPGGSSGLRMLRLEQKVNGLPVFQSETRFAIDRQGRLVKSVGAFVPAARSAARAAEAARWMSPEQAVIRLLASTGRTARAESFKAAATEAGSIWTRISENDDHVAGEISARRMLFPLAPGVLVPAWALVVSTTGDADWYALIDAETGDVLWRKNTREYASTHQARFRVYVQADGVTPADSPAPQSPSGAVPGAGTQFGEILPTIVDMSVAQNLVASPNGWIDDCPGGVCTVAETQTLGNNVLACTDRTGTANVCDTDADGVLDGSGRPTGNPDANARNRDFLGTAPRDFQTNFLPSPQGGAGGSETGQTATGIGASGTNLFDQFRRGSVTQQFYATNWYHDRLYTLGFDPPSANFQNNNFALGGVGGDRVLMDVQDGSGTNNANFSTPPDGTSGRAQMFRFTGPTVDRDGGLDTEILIHELTHGTSNRLVGNAAGLLWDTARGMGEGWSDFYALALLNNTNADNPDASYGSGGYATFKLTTATYLDNYVYGIRRFPYSTNNAVNPMTWADVDDFTNNLSGGIAPTPLTFFNNAGGMEVHNSGELWALSLWEVRSRIIADPAGANGSVPTGNDTTLEIVTDAMKLTPINPSFIDARDALFDADCASNACANEQWIWGGFADRGLGYRAAAPFNTMGRFWRSHMAIRESFSSPFLDVVNPATDVSINDTGGNSNGAIDFSEPILMTVTLTNPWRAASKAVIAGAVATLSTTNPNVTITDATSTFGAIAANDGTGAGLDPFAFTVSPAAVCGSSVAFSLSVTSNLGTTVATLVLRVGLPGGADPVVTYTRNPAPDLAIPDNRGLATSDSLAIVDDFEIMDLDFRLDSVTHAFAGDLTFMLRSPIGIGLDSVARIGVAGDSGFGGANITNMLIDDDVANTVANDMVQVVDAGAPYTKSWRPVWNSSWMSDPAIVGPPPPSLVPDPLGVLSRFDGASTQGLWSVSAADIVGADVGTLNAWSILVTPRHFTCATLPVELLGFEVE